MRQVIGVLLVSGMLAAGMALAQSPGPISAPAMKVGDRWTFKRTDRVERVEDKKVGEATWEIVAIGEKTCELQSTIKGQESTPTKFVYSRDGGVLVRGVTKFDPAETYLAFPLEQGKEWGGRYKFPSAQTSETVDAELYGKAVGWESVTVPAGTFKALKITYTGRWGMMRGPYRIGGEYVRAGWYVPEMKQFIRSEFKVYGSNSVQTDLVFELISAKLAD
jgi:hypothetical protein